MHFNIKIISLYNVKARETLFSKIFKLVMKITTKKSTKQ